MAGSGEWNVFKPFKGRMDDNNARTTEYGVG